MRAWTGTLPKDCVIKVNIFDVAALCPRHGRSTEVPAPELRSFRISAIVCAACLVVRASFVLPLSMAKRLRIDAAPVDSPIRLNVGGKVFDVSMETINAFQYLQARLGQNFKPSVDATGELFVDRCPELFEVLLQSVRSLTRPRQSYIIERKRDLLAECDFYGVSDWLHQSILGNTAGVFFRPEDRAIAAAERAAAMDLLNPFETVFVSQNASDLGMAVLLEDRFPRANFECPNAEVLLQRLDNLTKGVMSKIAAVPGIIAAGGAVAHALAGCHGTCTDVRAPKISSLCFLSLVIPVALKRLLGRSLRFASPVDLFLRCDENQGISKLKAVYEACQTVAQTLPQSGAHKNMLITRTSCTVTFFISNNKKIPPVQVHLYGSIGRSPPPPGAPPSVERDEPFEPRR